MRYDWTESTSLPILNTFDKRQVC